MLAAMPGYHRRMPDLTMERALGGLVAGVDEAGRGPLAGPVVAAAVILNLDCLTDALLHGLDDSKRLSRPMRVSLFEALASCSRVGIGHADVAEIDRVNILQATLLAMARAVAALGVQPDAALIDGNRAPSLPCVAHCIIGGDGRCLSVAAASVVAKVTRDRWMAALARLHPGYGWERNAGYGTEEHRTALSRLGVTPYHRRSFAPVRNMYKE